MIYFKEKKQILTEIVDTWNSQKDEEAKILFTSQMLDCTLDIGNKKPIQYDVDKFNIRLYDFKKELNNLENKNKALKEEIINLRNNLNKLTIG